MSNPYAQPYPPRKMGFFRTLFNISFTQFITLRVLRVAYVIFMVLIGMWALVATVALVQAATTVGSALLLAIPLAWLAAFISLILIRLGMEFTAVVFRIGQNTATFASQVPSEIAPGGQPGYPGALPAPEPQPFEAQPYGWPTQPNDEPGQALLYADGSPRPFRSRTAFRALGARTCALMLALCRPGWGDGYVARSRYDPIRKAAETRHNIHITVLPGPHMDTSPGLDTIPVKNPSKHDGLSKSRGCKSRRWILRPVSMQSHPAHGPTARHRVPATSVPRAAVAAGGKLEQPDAQT